MKERKRSMKRFVCKKCNKTYKYESGIKKHFRKTGHFTKGFRVFDVVPEKTIDDIYAKLDHLEELILLNPQQLHDIDIRSTKGKFIPKIKIQCGDGVKTGIKELMIRMQKIQDTLNEHLVKPSEFLKKTKLNTEEEAIING